MTGNPRLRRARMLLFTAAVLLIGLPAGWMAASAATSSDRPTGQSTAPTDDETGSTTPTARQGTLGARTVAPSADGRSAPKPGAATAPGPAAARPLATGPAAAGAAVPGSVPAVGAGLHTDIITTIFWAGEGADASNAYISNTPSAWDEIWSEHFGGVDDPTRRNGYYPAAFTPRENPFYFALPYSDFDDQGRRKPTAGNCSRYSGVTSPETSWCKNTWIRITKGGVSAYAQWQDVGPMETDDTDYVFGTGRPRNTNLSKAGLDVSPAVRDYLSLRDVDSTNWQFVSPGAVPPGPWKQIVTTSGLYWR